MFSLQIPGQETAGAVDGTTPGGVVGNVVPIRGYGVRPVWSLLGEGRRRFKTWVVSYVCMGSKAVCLLPVPGYGTSEFLTTHQFFTGLYGKPKIAYTDHAPSLVKAARNP